VEKIMNSKKFKLAKEDILPVATGYGGCIATDRIVVDGERVGYMYREKSANPADSGWRFFAGDENSSYMEDTKNHGIYDVNTIANYDESIVPFLKEDIGVRIERGVDGSLSLIVD
jgi:hypothetical protein